MQEFMTGIDVGSTTVKAVVRTAAGRETLVEDKFDGFNRLSEGARFRNVGKE